MTIKARYTHEWKNAEGEKQQLKVEAKSYAEAFRQFWTHFMTTDLHYTIETIENALIRTSESEHFVAVNGQKKKNIPVVENLYVYTHLTPKAMEKAYEKFLKHWNKEVTVEPQETTATDVETTETDLTEAHQAIDEELQALTVYGPEEAPTPEAEPEAEVKKLSPREEKKLKTAAILAAQREEKRKKKEAAEARKRAKLEAQKQQESQQEELDLPQM